MKERLQKILCARGVASRRAAEEMIAQGRVRVNGEPATLGQSADPDTDEILLDDKPLPQCRERVYILLNKPRGFVTTLSDERGRRTAAELVADCGTRVYPVGRLDASSEGLLLFTNDGAWAHALMHPRHEVEKSYLAWVTGFSDEGFARLHKPLTLDGYTIGAPQLCCRKRQGEHAQLEITIHEGRNRQVRRMCEAVGMHVTRLRRIREGTLQLGTLEVGKWRYLSAQEVELLRTVGEKHGKL